MMRLRTVSWWGAWLPLGLSLVVVVSMSPGCHFLPGSPLNPPILPADTPALPAPASGDPAAEAPSGQPEGTDQATTEHPIDLGVALRLAGVDNPTINLAQEQVREALAGQCAARALLLPSVNVGESCRLHSGALLSSGGIRRNLNLQGLYVGSGTSMSGNMVIPGVWLFAHLGDAVYQPLAASQRVSVRQSDAVAVRNSVLLEVAAAYLELVGAEARLHLLQQAETDVAEMARVTAAFADTGEGARSDANRAAANLELIRRQVHDANGGIAAASARLSRLLNLEPSCRLRSPGGVVEPVRLAPEDAELESLIAHAIEARPELHARAAAIQEASTRVRQERTRPWLPLVSMGYSAGGFGGGSDQAATNFSPLKGRQDFTVMLLWSVQNLGLGNCARVRRTDAVVGQAVADYQITLNQVRREVAEAQAAAKAAVVQLNVARSTLDTSEEGLELETERIKRGEGRPIELLDSFRQWLDNRQEVIRATIGYDIAQFRLFVALGRTPRPAPCEP